MLYVAAAIFVGSQQCAGCHRAIAAAYAKTPMAQSSGAVAHVPETEFTAAGLRYRIAENRLFFDGGSAPFHYFLGSNAKGRTFLFQREGYLFELPVSWFVHTGSWDASPGYERYREVRTDRPVDISCLGCHASQVRYVRGTQNRYADPPFGENGIACERCHGPGSEHVRNPAAAHMVNPAKIEAERRDSICVQCHLSGVSRVERAGRRFVDFRAGDKAADYATYFVQEGGSPDFRVTSHAERLAASACKQAAGDALWCGSCHDVHSNGDRTQATCIGCHAGAHHMDQSCASCHMPKTAAVDAGHGVFTDHRISRTSRPAITSPPGRRNLRVFLGTADDRALGIAYAEAGDPRAREYLERAKPADAPVLLRLASLEREPQRAAALYQGVLREDPFNTTALVNLGSLAAQSGRVEEAAQLWRRALETNPAVEGAVLNLAQVLSPAEVAAVLERYLEFNPGAANVRRRLETLRRRSK